MSAIIDLVADILFFKITSVAVVIHRVSHVEVETQQRDIYTRLKIKIGLKRNTQTWQRPDAYLLHRCYNILLFLFNITSL